MILVQDIIDLLRADLDAEDSDFYELNRDFLPAINSAVDWIVSVVNFGLGRKKISEELLQDVSLIRIFQANSFSRVFFDSGALGHDVWTILAIYPEPIVTPTGVALLTLGSAQSQFDSRISYVSSIHSAKRLTLEEWNEGANNPFTAGNNILANCTDQKTYAYKNPADYSSAGYAPSVVREIEVRPTVAGQRVAIAYAKVPTRATLATSNLDFPVSFKNVIREKSLQYISRKQGDGTTADSVSEKDLNILLRTVI